MKNNVKIRLGFEPEISGLEGLAIYFTPLHVQYSSHAISDEEK
jgi:hypothetical protein